MKGYFSLLLHMNGSLFSFLLAKLRNIFIWSFDRFKDSESFANFFKTVKDQFENTLKSTRFCYRTEGLFGIKYSRMTDHIPSYF